MSSVVSQSVRDAAEYWASTVRTDSYITVVAFTILYYDFALTVVSEIEFFWTSANWSIISVLFVVNRYFGLLGTVPLGFEYFGTPSEQTYHQAFAIATQAIVAIMLVIRTYALYDRSKRILAVLIVAHVGGAIGCLVAMLTTKSPNATNIPLPFTTSGCDLSLTNAQGLHIAFAWIAMLWFDSTIFTLTLVQTIRMRRYFPGGILEKLLRDGTIYFGIMVASNVSNIVTFLATPSGSNLKGLETTFTNVLSTTLTSRLILNLRDPTLGRPRRASETQPTTTLTSTAAPPTSSYMMSTRYTLTHIEAGGVLTNTEDISAVSTMV
ncbi:hypothetical protein GSI_13881 [Ganoderma sinense ZZ0214-1]|uniref:DUF6533 domain-containing protein n=1 Tax=Ganoderma sinense ZZ0214-1 TaxID=1077348 RepID=A0A2G8RRJ7_9APHY|nr:hypothetical protein GSI_13881 [Ganoderma sinense ZZ0214-1]